MKRDNKGLTVIESILFVAVMSVLLGIIAPQYLKYVEHAKRVVDADTAVKISDAFTRVFAIDNPDIHVGGYMYTAVSWDSSRKMSSPDKIDSFLDLVFLDLGSVPKVKSIRNGRWIVRYDTNDGHVQSIELFDPKKNKSYEIYPDASKYISMK